MKWIIEISIFVLIAFIILLLMEPERITEEMTPDHIFEQTTVPDDVRTLLVNSCLDCHSTQTRYLWYHRIPPASFLVNRHITEGRESLNLSEWGKLEPLQQLTSLDKMCQEIENGSMPLQQYLWMHPKAKLSDEEKIVICAWTEKESENLLIKMME